MTWNNRIVGEGEEAPDQLLANPQNFRRHPKFQQDSLEGALNEIGWIQRVIVNRRTGNMVDGHLRVEVAMRKGAKAVPVLYVDLSENEERIALATLDPISAMAVDDTEQLADLLKEISAQDEKLEAFLESLAGIEEGGGSAKEEAKATLAEQFIIPPFSVFDARQGYWTERKRAWRDLGIAGELGRDAPVLPGVGGMAETSNFDPVLAEVIVTWFCEPGGHVLDPFAGEATKGIVTAYKGREYTGVELRTEQVEENRRQAQAIGLNPNWVIGDSAKIGKLLPEGETYDLIWTSPPYYDLEIYSQSEKDGSAFETYEKFMSWYEGIFAQAVERLKPNRFAIVKIGDVRDKKTGAYRDFVSDNCKIFQRLGLSLYNEAILITPAGTLPQRAPKPFRGSRKLGKGHQNVLMFFNGTEDDVKGHFSAVCEGFNNARQQGQVHEKILAFYKGNTAEVGQHVNHAVIVDE